MIREVAYSLVAKELGANSNCHHKACPEWIGGRGSLFGSLPLWHEPPFRGVRTLYFPNPSLQPHATCHFPLSYLLTGRACLFQNQNKSSSNPRRTTVRNRGSEHTCHLLYPTPKLKKITSRFQSNIVRSTASSLLLLQAVSNRHRELRIPNAQ